MRRAVAGSVLALFAAGCSSLMPAPPPASGRVKLESRETFYDVVGTTAEDLYAQMRAKGLRLSRAVLFGDYRWDLSWKLQYESSWSGGACRMSEVLIRLEAQAILPRWLPPAQATAELRGQWSAFIRDLQLHEKGHADIAVRAARELKSSLQKLSAPQCEQMQGLADQLARGLIRHHREVDEQYDLDTRYGAVQGANWPPASLPDASNASFFRHWR